MGVLWYVVAENIILSMMDEQLCISYYFGMQLIENLVLCV